MKKLIDSESFVTRIREASKIRDLFLENNLKNAADDLTATIEHAKKNMFTIAVVGETKRGKSTLINGLLGRTTDALAPIGRFPTTNIITYYVNSSNESIHVLFQDNTSRSISAAEVRQYVCEDLNPQNQKKVKQLEIRGRFPLLGEDVCLADTPGANNALSNIHDLVLLEFLPNADAVVFLTTVGTPITASEQKLLQTITKDEAKKMFFVMNKADKCNDQELAEALEHNQKIIASCGFSDKEIIPLSAKSFYQTGSDVGTERLLYALKTMIENDILSLIEQNFILRVQKQIELCRMEVCQRLEMYGCSKEELSKKKEELHESQTNLSLNRERQESRFREAWDDTIDEYISVLDNTENQMKEEYREVIEQTPFAKIEPLSQTIHTDIMARQTELLNEPMKEFSQNMEQAVESLERDILEKSTCLTPQEISAAETIKGSILDTGSTILSGTPAIIGSVALWTAPSILHGVIAASIPAIASNPATWIPHAAGSVTAVGASSTVALISPFLSILSPIVLAYGGYKIFQTWQYKKKENRNKLQLSVDSLISESFNKMRDNVRTIKKTKKEFLKQYYGLIDDKLEGIKNEIIQCEENIPDESVKLKTETLKLRLETMKETF